MHRINVTLGYKRHKLDASITLGYKRHKLVPLLKLQETGSICGARSDLCLALEDSKKMHIEVVEKKFYYC